MMLLALSCRSLKPWVFFFFTLPFYHVVVLWSDRTQINRMSFRHLSTGVLSSLYWPFIALFGVRNSCINICVPVRKDSLINPKRQQETQNTNSLRFPTIVWLGLCHKKLLLGAKSPPKELLGDTFLCLGNQFGLRKKGVRIGKKGCKSWMESKKGTKERK